MHQPRQLSVLYLLLLAAVFAGFRMLDAFLMPKGMHRSVSVVRLAAKAAELELNQELTGKVTKVGKFGATIDLGLDLPGFVHKMDVSEQGIEDAKDKFSVGQEVQAFVKCVKLASKKGAEVRLTMVKMSGKPVSDFSVGDEVEGKVDNVSNSAVFVDIGAYLPGYLPKDEIPKAADLRDMFKPGQYIKVKILSIDDRGITVTKAK